MDGNPSRPRTTSAEGATSAEGSTSAKNAERKTEGWNLCKGLFAPHPNCKDFVIPLICNTAAKKHPHKIPAFPLPSKAYMVPYFSALLLGMMGAALFFLLKLPLTFLLGPLVFCLLAKQKGLKIQSPEQVMPWVRMVIGGALGASFTPQVIHSIPHYLPSIALVPVAAFSTIFAGTILLSRIMKVGSHTALYGSSPGSLAIMVTQAEEAGADVKQVALLHSFRLVLLLTFAPLAMQLIPDIIPPAQHANQNATIEPSQYMELFAGMFTGSVIARLLRIPGGLILGPMFACGALYGTGLIDIHLPAWLRSCAQVFLGISLGCRMKELTPKVLLQTLKLSFFMLVIAMTVGIACAFISARLTGISVGSAVLSFAPGGIAEMSLLAIALGLDPGFVAMHHTVRLALLSLSAPFLHKMFKAFLPSEAVAMRNAP